MNNYLVLATVCFIAMISPGPDFVLVTRNSLRYSLKPALATAAGIVAGCMIHASYCILGLALVLTQNLILFSSIRYLGACYLVYLGIKGLCAKSPESILTRALDETAERRVEDISAYSAFIQGFLCNLLNPKLAVFLLSLFTQFISPDASLGEKSAVAGIFVIESALYWPALVCLLQTRVIENLFARGSHWIDRTCGALLVGLGVRVAVSTRF